MPDIVQVRKAQFKATADEMEEKNPPVYLRNPYSGRWIQYGGRAYCNLKSGKYVDIRTRERKKCRKKSNSGIDSDFGDETSEVDDTDVWY